MHEKGSFFQTVLTSCAYPHVPHSPYDFLPLRCYAVTDSLIHFHSTNKSQHQHLKNYHLVSRKTESLELHEGEYVYDRSDFGYWVQIIMDCRHV